MEKKYILNDNEEVIDESKKKRKNPYDSMFFTSGDLDYNMKMFNKHFGTDGMPSSGLNGEPVDVGEPVGNLSSGSDSSSGESSGATGGEGIGESLINEAKDRNIRRYYIRPQNVYCSTKKDVLEALVKAGNENCSIYSLKRLDDKNKVNLLTTDDILYYYDDHVLYDKNHVQVLDYNLTIKHEETRKKFADIDAVPESSAEKAYSDRLTPFTVDDKKESFNIDFDNPFDLKFDDTPNAIGQRLTESGEIIDKVCCICGQEFEGEGHNPEPYMPAEDEDGNKNLCCDSCYQHFVVPAQENQDNVENNQSDENLEEKVNNTDKTLWVRKLQDIISKKEPYIVTLPNGKKVKAITPTEIDAKSGKVYYSEKDFDGWEW